LTGLEERRLSYRDVAMTKHEGHPRATCQHLPHFHAQTHTHPDTHMHTRIHKRGTRKKVSTCTSTSTCTSLPCASHPSLVPHDMRVCRSLASHALHYSSIQPDSRGVWGGKDRKNKKRGGDRKFGADSLNGHLDVAPNVLFLSLQSEGALAGLFALACRLLLALSQRDSGMHGRPHVLEYLQSHTPTPVHPHPYINSHGGLRSNSKQRGRVQAMVVCGRMPLLCKRDAAVGLKVDFSSRLILPQG
jgi:hypothetical protein